MRIDLEPILEQAQALIAAIEAKSQSRSCNAAHALLCALPSPMWAETAPGCAIYYGIEKEATVRLNALRRHAMTWLSWLTEPATSCEADDEWPQPKRLIEATRELQEIAPQNVSVSANTAPTVS